MMLLRYNPWLELNTLQRQINARQEDFQAPTFTKAPAAELHETEDAYHLKLELPGIQAKDVDIEVTQNAVKVVAERLRETTEDNNGKTKSEFYYGKFQRVIPLRSQIQNTNVKADYKDGILNLTLAKTEAEKNQVVKVNLEQLVA